MVNTAVDSDVFPLWKHKPLPVPLFMLDMHFTSTTLQVQVWHAHRFDISLFSLSTTVEDSAPYLL